MGLSYVGIAEDGKLKDFLHGFRTFANVLFAMNIM
jgi:hypothetical protein